MNIEKPNEGAFEYKNSSVYFYKIEISLQLRTKYFRNSSESSKYSKVVNEEIYHFKHSSELSFIHNHS